MSKAKEFLEQTTNELPDAVQDALYKMGWSRSKISDVKMTSSTYEVSSKFGNIDWDGINKLTKVMKKAKFYELNASIVGGSPVMVAVFEK